MKTATTGKILAGVNLVVAVFCYGSAWAADPFPASACGSLSGADLVHCQGVVSMSAQLAALQTSMDSFAGLAGTLTTPLTALSSLWTEEGVYFFLGVGLAMVFVRAMGSRW